MTVRLADKVTRVSVTEKLFLSVTLSHGGETFTMTDWFYPLDISHAVIIGYPTIISTAFPFCMGVFERHHARMEASADALDQLPAPTSADGAKAAAEGAATDTSEAELAVQLVPFLDALDRYVEFVDPESMDAEYLGKPDQVLWPEERSKPIEEINHAFAMYRAQGIGNLEVKKCKYGLSVHARDGKSSKMKEGNVACAMAFHAVDHDNFAPEQHFVDYAYDLGTCVCVPDPQKPQLGWLINDLLDEAKWNCKIVPDPSSKFKLRVELLRDLEDGEELSFPYGAAWWARWLAANRFKLPIEEWTAIRDQALIAYGAELDRGLHAVLSDRILKEPFLNMPQHAPEDDMVPEPATTPDDFLPGGDIGSMQDDYQERRAKYLEDVFGQFDPDFLNAMSPDMRAFMLSDEAIDVFVPKGWEGLKDPDTGDVIIHTIEWLSTPKIKKHPVIRVRPDIAAPAEKEVRHLLNILFWVMSTSAIASSMLVAPKATTPFIRIVTNYAWMKANMAVPKYPLRHVKDNLEFMSGGDAAGNKFRLYCDLDMLASFHQLRIDDASMQWLSVVTPWGQYMPQFLPEGIPPATAMLQAAVDRIFKQHEDRLLAIYDNFLLCGTGEMDMYEQLVKVFATCRRNNLFLKLSKCFFGVKQVKFFGYVCTPEKYYLDDKRVDSVQSIEYPGDSERGKLSKTKLMQSYLGMANFFSGFIPHYASETSLLYEMTQDAFDWKEASTPHNKWRDAFKKHKSLIAGSFEIYYPDYSLEWILRVDASMFGAGYILLQKTPEGILQPIQMGSTKFSEPAQRWHCFHQEAFAIFYAIKSLHVRIHGKPFILQTDHKNLLWMEQSTDVKIQRYVAAIANYQFLVEHIPGKLNIVADVMSRIHSGLSVNAIERWIMDAVEDPEDFFYGGGALASVMAMDDDPTGYILANIEKCHGGRHGHGGVARTWHRLNTYFPGHKWSVQQVRDFISECATCQQTRLRSESAALKPRAKHLPVGHARRMIAIDGTKVVKTRDGNQYLLVIYNMFTKHVVLRLMRDKTARACASALFLYFSQFGLCDIVHSDLGSDFTSKEVTDLLSQYLGVERTYALQGNPQADGVEPVVKEVLRHLTALVLDEDMKTSWDDEIIYGCAQLIWNEEVKHTTGVSPFHALFGDDDPRYFHMPSGPVVCDSRWVQSLAKHLAVVRERSRQYQLQHKKANVDAQAKPVKHNYFKKGDFVLVKRDKTDRPDKLTPRNEGPYEVVLHPKESNHVQVRSLITDGIFTFDLKDLMVFHTTGRDAATKAAQRALQEYEVDTILAFSGDPDRRAAMRFTVRFKDGDVRDLPFTELRDCEPFYTWLDCSPFRPLQWLKMTAQTTQKLRTQSRKTPINTTLFDTTFYLNLRSFGFEWYASRQLPDDKLSAHYYIEGRITRHPSDRRLATVTYPALRHSETVDSYWLDYHAPHVQILPGEQCLTRRQCLDARVDQE